MMELRLLGHIIALSSLIRLCSARFRNSFTNVAEGEHLLLNWDGVKEEDYPLVIVGSVVNHTESDEVNVFKANVKGKNFTRLSMSGVFMGLKEGLRNETTCG
jgi:hypothetical protein